MKLSIMRYLPLILFAALALIPLSANAQGTVIVIIDGLGSSYLSPHMATYVSGATISPVDIKSFDTADAAFQLKVPVPATEYAHAVIVTGYSNASQGTVSYYHATLFDCLKDDGYVTLGILENGDSREMLGKLDVAVREKNDSVTNPYFEFILNGHNVSPGLMQEMRDYPRLSTDRADKDPYVPYIKYNSWALGFARHIVQYMDEKEPGKDYVLIVNAGGLDSAGQNTGYEGYKAVLSGMDDDIGRLVDASRASGTILMVTGDHGMSFKSKKSRGSHSAADVASRNESLLVPLLIYTNMTNLNMTAVNGGTYGQECLAPTLLSLLGKPNTLSMSDGEPLPVKERPTLYLRSKRPINVTVTGPGLDISVPVNGIYGIDDLEKGNYTVHYGRIQKSIDLSHDEILDIREDGPSSPPGDPWVVYLAAAGISVAGICAALKLAWMRK